jgi:LmbE family N-acetylglucosaminyl deacetylase
MTQLGYQDGELSNNQFQEISDKIFKLVTDTLESCREKTEVIFVTYDNCGVTGHLDHIAMSFIATHVYTKLAKQSSDMLKLVKLRYACLCEAGAPENDDSFVFMPKGQTHSCIDETEDVSEFIELKKKVMYAHNSQRTDAKEIINRLGDNLAYEHFCIFKH